MYTIVYIYYSRKVTFRDFCLCVLVCQFRFECDYLRGLVTVKLHAAVFPAESVTDSVTSVSPGGNRLPPT